MDVVEGYSIGGIDINGKILKEFIQRRTSACGLALNKTCNDLVIGQLYAKDFPTALALSTKLVVKYPDDYSVVITHAAALELNGKIAEAMAFMKRALELDPHSHRDSEWIHLNFLEQRLKGTNSPSALIGVDLRPSDSLTIPNGKDLKQLLSQVNYQVNDRMFFTPKHDPLFGALLFAYADLLYLNDYRSIASDIYELAKEYGYDGPKASASNTITSPAPWEAPANTKAPAPVTLKDEGSNAALFGWLFVCVAALGMTLFVWLSIKRA